MAESENLDDYEQPEAQPTLPVFEKHASVLATGAEHMVMLSLSTLKDFDFSEKKSRYLFFSTNAHCSLLTLLQPDRIDRMQMVDDLQSTSKLNAYILFEKMSVDATGATFMAASPKMQNLSYLSFSKQLLNNEIVEYMNHFTNQTKLTGIQLLILELKAQQNSVISTIPSQLMITQLSCLSNLLQTSAIRKVVSRLYLDDVRGILQNYLTTLVPKFITKNVLTNAYKFNKNVSQGYVMALHFVLTAYFGVCKSEQFSASFCTPEVFVNIVHAIFYNDQLIYHTTACVLNQLLAQQAFLVGFVTDSEAVRRLCQLLQPNETPQFLYAASGILAKIARLADGDQILTESRAIQPIISLLQVSDEKIKTAAAQVVIGITQKSDGRVHPDSDFMDSNPYTVNHNICRELVYSKAISVLINNLTAEMKLLILEQNDISFVGKTPEQIRTTKLPSLRSENVTAAPEQQQQQNISKPAVLNNNQNNNKKKEEGEEPLVLNRLPKYLELMQVDQPTAMLSTYANIISHQLHALSNICADETAFNSVNNNVELFEMLIYFMGSMNPAILKWTCSIVSNICSKREIIVQIYKYDCIQYLFSIIKRLIASAENTAKTSFVSFNDYCTTQVIASAAGALSQILTEKQYAAMCGRTVQGVFQLILQCLKQITECKPRALLLGLVANLCNNREPKTVKEQMRDVANRENSQVFLEHKIVDFVSYLALETNTKQNANDYLLREQICKCIASICQSAPVHRSMRMDEEQYVLQIYKQTKLAMDPKCFMDSVRDDVQAHRIHSYGYGNVIAEFGQRGVLTCLNDFLSPSTTTQQLSLEEFASLKASVQAVEQMSKVSRNCLILFKQGVIQKLLWLIAVGDRELQAQAAKAVQQIRKVLQQVKTVARECGDLGSFEMEKQTQERRVFEMD